MLTGLTTGLAIVSLTMSGYSLEERHFFYRSNISKLLELKVFELKVFKASTII